MKRFWVSWWTANDAAHGVHKWPESLNIWISGQRGDDPCTLQESLCAVIDTDKSEAEIWAVLKSWFPDLEPRFITLHSPDFQPSNRFPGFDPARVTIERKELCP